MWSIKNCHKKFRLFSLPFFLATLPLVTSAQTGGLPAIVTPAPTVGPLPQQTTYTVLSTSPPLIKGSFRIRSARESNTDFANVKDSTLMRGRLDFKFSPNSELDVFFQPQFSKAMGEPTSTSTTTTAGSTASTSNTSGATTDTGMVMHQAFMDYHPHSWIKLLAGRQVLSYGDELVIGGLEWNNVGRSFDAVRVKTTYSFGWTDIFTSKLVDNTVNSSSTIGDKDLHGIYSSFSPFTWMKAFDLYYFHQDDKTASTTTGKKDLKVAGIRSASQLESFDYRAEYTKEHGSSLAKNDDAYQGDVEFGYKFLVSSWKARFAVEGFTSGSSYNQLYPTAHKWLGYADIFGRRNISGYAVHTSIESGAFVFMLDYHQFARTKDDATVYKLNGTTSLGSIAGSTSKELGAETDLTMKWKSSQNLAVVTGVSLFEPGAYLKDQFPGTKPNFYYLQMDLSF